MITMLQENQCWKWVKPLSGFLVLQMILSTPSFAATATQTASKQTPVKSASAATQPKAVPPVEVSQKSQNGAVMLSAKINDAKGGMFSFTVTRNGQPYQSATMGPLKKGQDISFFTTKSIGVYKVTYKLGNNSSQTYSFTIRDTIKPVVKIIYPRMGQTVSGLVPLSVQATDNDRVSTVYFQINNQKIKAEKKGKYYVGLWDTKTAFPDGVQESTHAVIRAVAYDAAENMGTSTAIEVMIKEGTDIGPGGTPNNGGGNPTGGNGGGNPSGGNAGGQNPSGPGIPSGGKGTPAGGNGGTPSGGNGVPPGALPQGTPAQSGNSRTAPASFWNPCERDANSKDCADYNRMNAEHKNKTGGTLNW